MDEAVSLPAGRSAGGPDDEAGGLPPAEACGSDTVVHRGVLIRAGDGVPLATDIYRPARDGQALPGRFPAVIERTPYDRGRAPLVELARFATRRGYVFATQDVRGRGDSGGTFRMYMNEPDEGSDGADSMRWIVRQPWCDGRIATSGGSFSAANQQAAALHHPPGLRAQFQRDGGVNYHRRALRTHGAFNLGLSLPWVVNQAVTGPRAQADPHIVAELRRMQRELPDWISRFPWGRGESPLALCPDFEELFFTMYETDHDADFWRTPTARLEGHWDEYPTDVAVLMVSGWYAHHVAGNFDKLRELGSRLKRPVSLVVGPWVHGPGMLEATWAGDAEFGPAAAEHGPVAQACFDWLDHFMDGTAGDADRPLPPLRYFRMGSGDGHRTEEGRIFHGGEWHSAGRWPPPGTVATPYHLGPDGSLSPHRPGEDGGSTTFDFDPANPCPTLGATNLQDPGHPDVFRIGPQDGGPLSGRPDVRVFQTAPLTAPLEVTGDVEVVLWCATSAPDTDFVAKLLDVYPPGDDHPDGYALLLCEDIVRLRHRDDNPGGELPVPGEVLRLRIPIGPTSNLFKAGHRVRVDITSSSFPEYDVNPNTGEPPGHQTHLRVARQTIRHDAAGPSHIVLPIRPM